MRRRQFEAQQRTFQESFARTCGTDKAGKPTMFIHDEAAGEKAESTSWIASLGKHRHGSAASPEG